MAFKIAHHECINKIRDRRWDKYEEIDDYLADAIAEMPVEEDISSAMAALMEHLSFVDRNIMLLRYRTGLDFQEIADICEMKLSAVKMRHKRVFDFLQEKSNTQL